MWRLAARPSMWTPFLSKQGRLQETFCCDLLQGGPCGCVFLSGFKGRLKRNHNFAPVELPFCEDPSVAPILNFWSNRVVTFGGGIPFDINQQAKVYQCFLYPQMSTRCTTGINQCVRVRFGPFGAAMVGPWSAASSDGGGACPR